MKRRIFSFLMALVMVLSILPMPALAADGLCEHHPAHTADCGYVAPVVGQPCSHEGKCSGDTCGYVPAQPGVACGHKHDETCGWSAGKDEVPCDKGCAEVDENGVIVHAEGCAYAPAVAETPCSHQCSLEVCGYVAPVEGVACGHEHDGTCGYVQAVEGHACTFDCQLCKTKCTCQVKCNEQVNQDCPLCSVSTEGCQGKAVADAPICNCADKCTEGAVKSDCPVCGIENADLTACIGTAAPVVTENAKAVQALIDALPTLDEVKAMTMEEQKTAYEQTQAAYSAYEALTPEEQAQVDVTKFADLFGYFNTLVMTPVTEEDAVAVVNGVYYDNLIDALQATRWNVECVLLKDVELTADISNLEFYGLNLNGHTISGGKTISIYESSDAYIKGPGTIIGNLIEQGTEGIYAPLTVQGNVESGPGNMVRIYGDGLFEVTGNVTSHAFNGRIVLNGNIKLHCTGTLSGTVKGGTVISTPFATSVTVDSQTATLDISETKKLTATVLPAEVTNKAVNWSSSNPNIATVDSTGTVTAVGQGQATITATAVNCKEDNITATCTITVVEPVAKIGETKYTTFEAAVDALNGMESGGIIELLKGVTLNSIVTVSKNLTLIVPSNAELKGTSTSYLTIDEGIELTANGYVGCPVVMKNNSKILDGSFESTISGNDENTKYTIQNGIFYNDVTSATIENGTFEQTPEDAEAVQNSIITGGKFQKDPSVESLKNTIDMEKYQVTGPDQEGYYEVTLKPHVHSFEWKADDDADTITGICNCDDTTTTTIIATLTAPNDLIYNRSAKEAPVKYSDNWTGDKPTVTYSSGGNVNAGSVTATMTLGEKFVSVEYIIAPRPVTIKADDKSATVGDVMPQLTSSITGLLDGDTLTPKISCDADMSKAGIYDIIVKDAVAGPNYTLNYVNGKLTVSAKPIVYHTVKFDSNGGSAVADHTVESGGKVVEPKDPTRSKYTFKGWFTDEKCTKAYDFDTEVTSSFTLYAKWKRTSTAWWDNPKTGDYIMIAVGVLVVSGAALAGLLVYSKKKKK